MLAAAAGWSAHGEARKYNEQPFVGLIGKTETPARAGPQRPHLARGRQGACRSHMLRSGRRPLARRVGA